MYTYPGADVRHEGHPAPCGATRGARQGVRHEGAHGATPLILKCGCVLEDLDPPSGGGPHPGGRRPPRGGDTHDPLVP